ncbi:hypothetical protein C8R45DRAFT_932907 [Mycena sanguinolenta]|nr:hypothetical protein C8R45DRAFT_932907 [Mycena sanguinolenta]
MILFLDVNSIKQLQFLQILYWTSLVHWNSSKLSGDTNQQCRLLLRISDCKIQSADYSSGEEYARKAQQLSELSMDLYHSAVALRFQAECSTYLGNYPKGLEQLYRARKLLEICGMSGGLTHHFIALDQAEIHLLKTEYVHAQSILSNIAETTALDQNTSYTTALLNLAYIDTQIGNSAANVCKNLDIVGGIFKSLHRIALCKMIAACLDLREHKFDLAQRKFLECLDVTIPDIKSVSLEQLANIMSWPAADRNVQWPVIYLSFAYKSKEKLAVHKALLFLGDVFANKDEHTASTLYTVALEGFIYMDVHRSQAECMLRLGDLAKKHGDITAAIAHWKRAGPLFEKSSQAESVAQIDTRLASVAKAHEEVLPMLDNLETPIQSRTEFSSSQEQPLKVALV